MDQHLGLLIPIVAGGMNDFGPPPDDDFDDDIPFNPSPAGPGNLPIYTRSLSRRLVASLSKKWWPVSGKVTSDTISSDTRYKRLVPQRCHLSLSGDQSLSIDNLHLCS